MITTRKIDTRGQAEPLPMYGWRCGMYGLTPELTRHGQNPEFLQRRLDASYRAAARSMGKMSCLGRDMGDAMVSKSDAEASYVAELWAEYNKLSSAYETERRRLLALRGM